MTLIKRFTSLSPNQKLAAAALVLGLLALFANPLRGKAPTAAPGAAAPKPRKKKEGC